MDPGTIFLAVLAIVFLGIVVVFRRDRLGDVFHVVKRQGGAIALRVPLALLSAAFIGQLMPPDFIGGLIGGDSGWRGILVASALGGIVPGGPTISFPLAIVIWQMGAGEAQMVAFLAAWSIFALHRVIAYEWPMMGMRFVLLRFASSFMLPPLAGFLALLLIGLVR